MLQVDQSNQVEPWCNSTRVRRLCWRWFSPPATATRRIRPTPVQFLRKKCVLVYFKTAGRYVIIVIRSTSVFLNFSWIVFNFSKLSARAKLLNFLILPPILKSLHWLKYKVLTATEPSACISLSSSFVTVSRPSSSSLKITNRSFCFASPHLWNQLPVSCRQSSNQSPSHSLHFTYGSSRKLSFLSSLSPLFHSRLKTYLFSSLSHYRLLVPYPWTAFSDLDCFSDLLCSSVFIFLSLFLFSFWSRVVD